MKKIIIPIVLLVLIAIGGIGYWQYTVTKPEYSLWQVKKAVDDHDLIMFEKYVDTEGVVESLIDQFMDISMGSVEKEGDGLEGFGAMLAKGLVTMFKPQLTKMAKQQVINFVETGDFENKNKSEDQESLKKEDSKPKFSLNNIWSNSGGDKNEFNGIAYVKEEGKIAYIGLEFFSPKYKETFIIDIKMRGIDNYWQVAEFSNFSELMKKIEKLDQERLEALNKPVIEQLKRALIVEKVKKFNSGERWDKKVNFRINLKNLGIKIIDEYKIKLICTNSSGKRLKQMSLKDDEDIAPNQSGVGTWSSDVNMFSSDDEELYKTQKIDLEVLTEVFYIKFKDGSELKLYEKGDI